MRRGLMALALAAASGAVPAAAQDVDFAGQVRPRVEFRSPEGFSTDLATVFTSMRTRLSLSAALPRDVTAFVQVQDVRLWGEEASTVDGSAESIDFHQAWVELGSPAEGTALRVGRQELSYGEQRLIGALDWVQQARSFDGVRGRARNGDVVVDGFALRIREDEVHPADASFLGLYGTLPAAGMLDLYALHNTVGDDVTEQWTVGGRWSRTEGPLGLRVEAAYQAGTRSTLDVSAYLLAISAALPLGERTRAELWYDRLSGDDDPLDDEIRVFDTLFATNHKFYGFMDLFTDIPAHTGGRGLQDVALKTTFAARPDVSLGADLHAFFLTATEGLESGHLGEELDLTGRWAYAPGTGISGGVAIFQPGDAWADEDLMSWMFLMMDVTF